MCILGQQILFPRADLIFSSKVLLLSAPKCASVLTIYVFLSGCRCLQELSTLAPLATSASSDALAKVGDQT